MLKFWPPGINPELMMECKLIAHPTCFKNLKKPSRIMTLSCDEASIRLRPEWPWRAQRYRIVTEESEQYWNLFFCPPPPAMLFFHFSSDHWWQYKKWFWRWSFILQNSIAPSLSRGRLPWRRRWINFFDSGWSESECFPGSTSVQVLFPIRKVLVDELAESSRFCGFALAFDRLAKSPAFNFNSYSPNCISEVSCSLLFKFVTNLFKPWKNSDPRVRTVFVYTFNLKFPLHIHLANNCL